MTRESLKSFDEKIISLAVWDDVKNPKGIVQIAHGMAEHIGRYDEFATNLNKNGFIVIGDDHRAHGLTDKDGLGKAYGDLFEDTVKDMLFITDYAKQKYNLPLVLFGHSYGSFLSQRYISLRNNADGVVLCGSALMKGAAVNLGYFVANGKVKKGKKDDGAKFLAKVTFESYGKKFDGGNSWLSTDSNEVKKYDEDGLCGFLCSYGFYQSFFKGLKTINKGSPLSKNINMYIIAGEHDPVGGFGKSVKKLYNKYKKINEKTTLKLYQNMRHEILNDDSRVQVTGDVIGFLNTCVLNQN